MLTQQLCYSLNLHMGHIFLVHFDYSSFIVPAGLFRQISKQMSLVLRPMFQVSVLSVMNFSYQLSLYTSDVNLQVSLLRCIRHSVDGFEQVSSVDYSGIKGVNFQCRWIVSSDIETSVFGVVTDVPGLSIVMLTYKKSSLLLELFLVKS
ncbi:uncharacterized protein [Dysidea avara]|uniref:uncharacterized protein isoform X1 n=2 Tax=Dysidea avara TaxID=196820 RepID=UPI00332289CD